MESLVSSTIPNHEPEHSIQEDRQGGCFYQLIFTNSYTIIIMVIIMSIIMIVITIIMIILMMKDRERLQAWEWTLMGGQQRQLRRFLLLGESLSNR